MTANKTLVERLPRKQAGGTDVFHQPTAADEQWRLWVDGETYPRIVLDVFGAQILVGSGAVPPTPITGGGAAPLGASYITLASEPGLPNESQLGTVIRRDIVANRGAFGNAGVIFAATDTLLAYRDSGTSWDPLFPVLNGSGQIVGSVLPASGVAAATYGDGMHVGQFTVDASGRLTSAVAVPITRIVQIQVTDPQGPAFSAATGAAIFRVNSLLNGGRLTAVAANVLTASAAGLVSVQIVNITQAGVSLLSTPLTIDATELDSSTAATPAVINGANNLLTTADQLRIDITGAGSGAIGLIVELTITPA